MDPLLLVVGLPTIVALLKEFLERRRQRERQQRVDAAEEKVIASGSDALHASIESLKSSQTDLEVRAKAISALLEASQQAIVLGNLFNLYNKQIERYQEETRSRASWSFYIALIAMSCGFAFMFWGGQRVITDPRWDHIAAGSLLAAIGGGISAFVTKTFLDVHQLSLQQLNRYFDQPVINDHILMAQRLADGLPDPSARQAAYQQVIGAVTSLVRSNLGTAQTAGSDTTRSEKAV